MKKTLTLLILLFTTLLSANAEEITVWEGELAGNLQIAAGSDSYNILTGDGVKQANLSVGDIITITYKGATDGNKLFIQDTSWSSFSSLLTGVTNDLLEYADPNAEYEYTFYVSQALVDAIKNGGGIFFQRGGSPTYKFLKLTVTKGSEGVAYPSAKEKIIFFGNTTDEIYINNSDRTAAYTAANPSAGDLIKVYMSNVEADDKIWIKKPAGDWNQLNDTDVLSADQQVFTMRLTAANLTTLGENRFCVQKSGSYIIRYITISKYDAPGYELLYDGSFYIDWSYVENYYVVPSEDLSNLIEGDILHAYGTSDGDEHNQHKFAWNKTNVNGSIDDARLVSGTQTVNSNSHFSLTITKDYYNTITANNLVISGYWYYLTKLFIEHPTRFVSVTTSAEGLATFSNASEAVDCSWFESLGIRAYKAEISGDRIVTTQVTDAVPAGTGLILQGSPNTIYKLPFAADADAIAGNVLEPTNGSAITGYVLGKVGGNVGFYKVTNKEVVAGKAYIPATFGSARAFSIDFLGNDVTGIEETLQSTATPQAATYNLMGQRVAANQKGLVIVNGKKYINK